MSKLPGYVSRFVKMPEILAHLETHVDGMPLQELAAHFSVAPDKLHEDLLSFYMADALAQEGSFLGLSRPPALEFSNADGEEIDPNEATWVRLVQANWGDETGAEYLDSAELGLIWTAATALAALEPDDQPLKEAIDVLAETLFEGVDTTGIRSGSRPDDRLQALRTAVEEKRTVRIRYSRAWLAGQTERTIAPVRLVQTHRGWEVDAAVVEHDCAARTFLVSNIRDLEMVDDAVELPADMDERIARNRATQTVRLALPHGTRWVADMYAERVEVCAEDETHLELELDLLPPVEHRVGLILLTSGEESRVISPPRLVSAAADTASVLLAHHSRVPAP